MLSIGGFKMKNRIMLLTIIIITLILFFSVSAYAEDYKTFEDINVDSWFAKDVEMLYKLGIINGKLQNNGKVIFDSKGLVSKAEFTKMLVEALDYKIVDGNSFNDVGYDRHWARKHIETALNENIINPEIEGDKYWPDIPIKRSDMALMMFKALGLEESDSDSPFPDTDLPYVTKLHEEFLISGVPKGDKVYFMASGLTSRAEAAAIIARMVEYKDGSKAYKDKKIKEAKELEFIEPELVIKHRDYNWGGTFFRVGIRNIFEYDYHYMFKIECLNDERISFAQVSAEHPVVDQRWWSAYSTVAARRGELKSVKAAFTGSLKDRNGERDLPMKEGDKFDFKVTIIKTKEGKPITKHYYKPTAEDNYKEYYISGTIDLDAYKDDPEYRKGESKGVIPWNIGE